MLPTLPSLRQPEYQISNSLRFRSSANAYLQRTPAVQGTRSKWTFSCWVKRGTINTDQTIFDARDYTNGTIGISYPYGRIAFTATGELEYVEGYGNVNVGHKRTIQLFRDVASWYHIVVALDTTLAAAERAKIYVNGSRITSFSINTHPSGYSSMITSTVLHRFGANITAVTGAVSNPCDAYFAEVHLVDGQALTPAAFGAISSRTGVWAPRKYLGTYGTNGFYLDFADNSAATSATIGKDRSGNYNSWIPTNISMVAGVTFDSMTDTPTQVGDVSYYYSGTQYPYNALQFRSSASTYLSRTPASAGNQRTWTFSAWLKRSSTGTGDTIFHHGSSENDFANISFGADNVLAYQNAAANVVTNQIITTQTFADTSKWYHVVIACDTTQATNTDKMKFYVDGVQVTSFSTATYPATNFQTYVNSTQPAFIGRNSPTGIQLYGGYMAEINLIDGQALTPASFGETINGTWVPKTYTGTYGTNGFYLKFNDNSAATAAALGRDSAGTNNWTPTNLATTDVTSTEITSRSLVNPSYGLQFRSSGSTYLSRTPALSNRKTFTWSGWVKRSSLGTVQYVFSAGTTAVDWSGLAFNGDQFYIANSVSDSGTLAVGTAAVFRDLSTWYHIVASIDTTQALSTNGVRMWVNGVAQTLNYQTYTQNTNTQINNAIQHSVGSSNAGVRAQYFDGILADVNFIDGQALTPSSFGETNSTGTWVPKAYSGTYGTNGFYLNFADRSAMTPAAIGDDASSNNNQWTPNNMGPTDAIDYGVKTARGNYAVLNPVNASMGATIVSANLTFVGISNTNAGHVASTIGVDSGAYYFEFIPSSFTGILEVYLFAGGIAPGSVIVAGYRSNGTKDVDDVNSAYGAAWTAVDHIGCAFNVSTKTVTFYKNNVSQGTFSYVTTGELYPAIAVRGTGSANGYVNFGQRPFAYTPPAGFKALCTQNLPEPAIVHGHAYMAATTYTGTGVGRNISNFSNNRSFRPDLVWIKSRSNATDHALYDTLRGAQQDLVSSSTAAETTQSTGLTAFREDGFGLSTLTKLNSAGNTYVAWQWKAGDSTVTNTAGSITSQVDAGTTQGVSVVTYTGTGANATVGHGLGVAPSMVIVKSRTTGSWQVRHTSIAAANSIQLNNTDAAAAAATVWNSTAPTSSVLSIGTSTDVNSSGVGYVAYCFAEIAGYSKFGSYTGNGSADGPFVFCNFRPKWVMVRQANISGQNWAMFDTTRSFDNIVNDVVSAESTSAEAIANYIDVLSNGFKLRNTLPSINATGNTYIYAAFAEVPSKYALAR